MILQLIAITLIPIFKAIADTLAHHFDTSIFKKLDSNFWNPDVSWRNKYEDVSTLKRKKSYVVKLFGKHVKIPAIDAYSDAWHISNAFALIFILMAIVTHEARFKWFIEYPVYGIWIILIFNLFYNKILKK